MSDDDDDGEAGGEVEVTSVDVANDASVLLAMEALEEVDDVDETTALFSQSF